jgi:predicted nucleic acid-binding protein
MKNIVFDSYAIIAHFRKEKGYEEVSNEFSEITGGSKEGFMSLINVGEVYYILHRLYGVKYAERALETIQQLMPIQIVPPDFELTLHAAKIKAAHKMSYADGFAAALTLKKKATLITGDKEFKALEGEMKIKFIK